MTTLLRQSGKRALVVGGTGPTGPDVVGGLLNRGYETAIFHGGKHEVPLPGDVEHIHGDAHFPESIDEALRGRDFDVVIAQYGRLRHLVDFFAGRIEHMVAIGGMNAPLSAPDDPVWGPMGRPPLLREDQRNLISHLTDDNKLGYRIAEAARHLFEAHASGAFKATYLVYPTLYGPRQPASPEWWIVRRILDGRRRIILPDAGIRLETRGYVHNVSQAALLAIDQPQVADGKTFVVADRDTFTTRQRVDRIAAHMGVELEIVGMPFALATPAHPFYRQNGQHRGGTSEAIRQDLGYVDRYDVATALADTADWLIENPAEIPEIERQLGDRFDYDYEDRLLEWWERTSSSAPRSAEGDYAYSHIYRHPTRPGEDWKAVDGG